MSVDKSPKMREDHIDLKRWRERHELRRSSAASPHRNRKVYTRKKKHANQED